MAYLGFDL